MATALSIGLKSGLKVEGASPGRLNSATTRRSLVAGEVVHDDEVAGPEFRHEHLVDIGLEGVPVDRPSSTI